MTIHHGILRIDRTLLLSALRLPLDTEIHACQMSLEADALDLRISHQDLPEVEDGAAIPRVGAQFKEYGLVPTRDVEFMSWEYPS